MEEKIEHYKQMLDSSGIGEQEDFGYIPERLKEILKELKNETKDDIFEAQNFCMIFGVASGTFSKMLNNKAGTSFRVIFKVIHFFSLMGYNPLWIINRDNLLVPKKHGESEFVMNKTTVDAAFNQLVAQIKSSHEETTLALDKFKKDITS